MLHECGDCTTRYAWDLQRCPNCGSEKRIGATIDRDPDQPGKRTQKKAALPAAEF